MGRVSRLTSEQVKDIRESTAPVKEIAALYQISQCYVSAIRHDSSRGKSLESQRFARVPCVGCEAGGYQTHIMQSLGDQCPNGLLMFRPKRSDESKEIH